MLALQRAPWLRIAAATTLLVLSAPASDSLQKEKSKLPAARWDEQTPGCTFLRGEDGKLRYGLWYGDVGITVAVDAQELEKVHRRHEPFFGVLLNVRYRGRESIDVNPQDVSLEFVKHFQVVQPALDPEGFSQKVQHDADLLNDQTAREIKKHPEKQAEREAYMRAFLKDATGLQEFIGKNSLRETRLDSANPETSGWILFSTESRWISGWKKQEEFTLRFALGGVVYEFPFELPPKPGAVLLRKRH
jgi:hypothetical protein